jgi:hypothetical protein
MQQNVNVTSDDMEEETLCLEVLVDEKNDLGKCTNIRVLAFCLIGIAAICREICLFELHSEQVEIHDNQNSSGGSRAMRGEGGRLVSASGEPEMTP